MNYRLTLIERNGWVPSPTTAGSGPRGRGTAPGAVAFMPWL